MRRALPRHNGKNWLESHGNYSSVVHQQCHAMHEHETVCPCVFIGYEGSSASCRRWGLERWLWVWGGPLSLEREKAKGPITAAQQCMLLPRALLRCAAATPLAGTVPQRTGATIFYLLRRLHVRRQHQWPRPTPPVASFRRRPFAAGDGECYASTAVPPLSTSASQDLRFEPLHAPARRGAVYRNYSFSQFYFANIAPPTVPDTVVVRAPYTPRHDEDETLGCLISGYAVHNGVVSL